MKIKKSLACLLSCLCVGILSFGFACDGTTLDSGTSENSAASSMENSETSNDESTSTDNDESSVEDTSSNVSKGEQVANATATAWEKALENAWGYDFVYNQYISYVDAPSLFYSLQLICANSTIWMRGMGRDAYEEHRIISYDTLSCLVWKDEKCYVYGKVISDGILVDFQDWTSADDLEDGDFNGRSFEDVADEAISETLDLKSELEWFKSLYASVTFDENEGVYRAENFENKSMQITILIKDGKVKKIERSYTTQSTENPDGKARTYKESLELGGASEALKEVMPQFPSDAESDESYESSENEE